MIAAMRSASASSRASWRGGAPLRRARAGAALLPRGRGHPVHEIVRLHPQALAAGHLHERALVPGVGLVAEHPRRRVRQGHHLVRHVHGAFGRAGTVDGREGVLEELLQVRLARVDDVVDGGRAAERRGRRPAAGFRCAGGGRGARGCPFGRAARGRRRAGGFRGGGGGRCAGGCRCAGRGRRARRRPERSARGLGVAGPIVEVAVEDAELPELVRDVLADVGHGAVGAHDDLGARLGLSVAAVRLRIRAAGVGERHHPAAGLRAARLQVDRTGLLEHLESARPELEAQDVALPAEQVVVDVEPAHRREVAAYDSLGDDRADLGCRVAGALDLVQRAGAQRQAVGVGGVPLGDAGVQVPAVVVERGLGGTRPDVGDRGVLELLEADDDVRHLHAGVVDVVLHLDGGAQEAQRARQRVAEGRVAQMADVRRLVGIDRGVLDDHLGVRCGRRRGLQGRRTGGVDDPARECLAVEKQVDVTVGSRLGARDPVDGAERGDRLGGDAARRLAQPSRELEGERRAQVAQGAVRRRLDGDLGQRGRLEFVELDQHGAQPVSDRGMEREDHRRGSSTAVTPAVRRPGRERGRSRRAC